MRRFILFLFPLIAVLFLFAGCKEDMAKVKLVVKTDTPGAVVTVISTYLPGRIRVKNYWEIERVNSTARGEKVRVYVESSNYNILLTAEVYVNGFLVSQDMANGEAVAEYEFK